MQTLITKYFPKGIPEGKLMITLTNNEFRNSLHEKVTLCDKFFPGESANGKIIILVVGAFGIEVQYYLDGKYHRKDGPAREWIFDPEGKPNLKKSPYGIQIWYTNGNLHRDDGPALVQPIMEYWYKDGKRIHDLEHTLVDPKMSASVDCATLLDASFSSEST